MTITREQFITATGREPENDDLERCNCESAGALGHSCCGWNRILNRPVFQFGPEDGMVEVTVASVVETADALRAIYERMNERQGYERDAIPVFVMGDGIYAPAVTIESLPFAVLIRDHQHRTACGYLAQHLDREGAPFLPLPVLRDEGADGTTVIGSVRRVVSNLEFHSVFLMLN